MDFETLKTLDQQYIAHTYGRLDLGLVQGKGALAYDCAGKEYLDFTSGIGVNSLGFCDGEWAEAVARQAKTLNHTSNLYYTQPAVLAAEKLCTRAGMKKVFFANSGAEANEGAIKTARKYAQDHYGPQRHEIVTLKNSFHGRTIATIKATGQEAMHQHFAPFPEGFRYASANDMDSVLAAVNENTCAIMMELIQGEGGVIPLDPGFVASVAALCRQRDILLIVDEVQTGIGRTGSLFCYQQYGVLPDLVTAAKGLGGGLPIGAVLFGEKCENTLQPGQHATTFGANPIVCAGANVVLDRLDDAFLQEVAHKGTVLKQALQALPRVVSVDGLGLMLGVQFEEGIAGRDVLLKCMQQGVLFLTAKQKLRLLPPLCITEEQIQQGVAILCDILKNWED